MREPSALSSWNYTSLQIVKLFYCVRKWTTCFWKVCDVLISPSILELIMYVSLIWRSPIMIFSRTKGARLHCTPILHRKLWKRRRTTKLYSLKPFLHSSVCLSLYALKYPSVICVLFFYSVLFLRLVIFFLYCVPTSFHCFDKEIYTLYIHHSFLSFFSSHFLSFVRLVYFFPHILFFVCPLPFLYFMSNYFKVSSVCP